MPSRKLLRRAVAEESDDDVQIKPTLAEQLNQDANADATAEIKSGQNSVADPNSQEEQPQRRLRKIKRRLKTYDEDAEDDSVQGDKKSEKDSDGEFSLQDKVDRMTKRINNRGKLGKIPKKDKKPMDEFKLDGYSDSDSGADAKEIKPKK